MKRAKGGVVINIKVEPRSSYSGIVGIHGDGLKVRLKSPPVEGRANKELVDILSDELGIPRSDIEIISGKASRNKLVRLNGISVDRIRQLQCMK
ncbi:MAG: hypothetical protein Fur0020_06470 [Thermodesulfovibrionia bacterium]